ncbi:hypothetical protein FVW27_05085 [Desulfovibrio sp. XJ01]|nr:hypothetical protein [Nitratidesulfovibrio liaohensis]
MMSVEVDMQAGSRLANVSECLKCSPGQIASGILNTFFESGYVSYMNNDIEKRRVHRKFAKIDAIAHVSEGENQYRCTPTVIRNISLCGVRAEIHHACVEYERAMREAGIFELMFTFPSDEEVVTFNCQIRYMAVGDRLVVGGAFVTPDIISLRALVRFLLSQQTESGHDAVVCRENLQVSDFPTSGTA